MNEIFEIYFLWRLIVNDCPELWDLIQRLKEKTCFCAFLFSFSLMFYKIRFSKQLKTTITRMLKIEPLSSTISCQFLQSFTWCSIRFFKNGCGLFSWIYSWIIDWKLKEVFEGLGSFCVSTPSSSKWAIVVSSLLHDAAGVDSHGVGRADAGAYHKNWQQRSSMEDCCFHTIEWASTLGRNM